jgi:hypothetical protein
MSTPQRCLIIVPNTVPELYTQVVAAFAADPRVFVLRDRRVDDRGATAVGVFAVGGGPLDPALRRVVAEKLRTLGVEA